MSIQSDFKATNEIFFLVEVDFDGMKYRWAEHDIQIDSDVFFEGKILQIGNVGSSFDIASFKQSMGSVSVTLANDDRFQDVEMTRVLDGAIGKIYAYCSGLTWAEVQAFGLLYTGIFKKGSHSSRVYQFSLDDATFARLRTMPPAYINDTTFSAHRKVGGGGSVSGQAMPIVFGEFDTGIPLLCVDTSNFYYLLSLGQIKSVDADFTATTENVYDKDGAVIAAAGYSLTDGITDSNPFTYVNFNADQVDSEKMYCSVKGISDSSGEITGTADTLIEHPAHIFRYLIDRYGINISVDYEGVGTCQALLPYVKFASYINSPANAGDVIQRILGQIQSSLVVRNGRYGILTFNPDGEPTNRLTKQAHHIGGAIVISKTDMSRICNHLIVNYARNMTSGNYEKQIVRTKDNNNFCEISYYQYGERPAVILNLPDVNNQIVAELLANRYLSIHSHRHDIVNLTMAYGDGFDIVEGDAALWTIPEGASTDGTGWHDEKLILLDRTFTKTGIQQRWWRPRFIMNYAGTDAEVGGYVYDTEGDIILDTAGRRIRATR